MAIRAPFNIRILDPDAYIQQRQLLPVSAQAIFEASSNRFHPEGLFSEVIFGQVGSRERLVRRGFIDIRTKIISPHLFKQLMSLKGFYQDICASKTYAIYDRSERDFVRVPKDDPKGETGYSFFLRELPKVVFPETDSAKRHTKIELLKKYRDLLLMTRFIVLPAGVRDIKEQDDRLSVEEINKYYTSILSLVQALPEGLSEDPVYDGLRYQIQIKVQMVYTYILDLLDDKGGFVQSKYSARNVVYASRNVITAAPMTLAASPEAPNFFHCDEVQIPLFQSMKSAVPLIINRMKNLFFDQIFVSQSTRVPAIREDTQRLEYIEISPSTLRRYTTAEGITDIINEFRDTNVHFKPVTIDSTDPKEKVKHFMYLIYDDEDVIYYFRDLGDFTHVYSNESNYTTQNVSNLDRLEKIGIPPEKCIIMGSTALSVFGMTHYNQDLDLIVAPDIFDHVKTDDENFDKLDYGAYRSDTFGIDVYNDVPGIIPDGFEKCMETETIKVDGYNFISPAKLQQIYQTSDRPKDIDKLNFLKTIVFDPTKVRPMTMVEMCYIATFDALTQCRTTVTRHPVVNLQGIQIFKPHLLSTNIGRIVTLKSSPHVGTASIVLPEYPVLTDSVKATMCIHPSAEEQYGADHDGDVMGLNIIMSEEAVKEIDNFMESTASMVDTSGRLIRNANDIRSVKYAFFCVSWHPLD